MVGCQRNAHRISLIAAAVVAVFCASAHALITGGTGNEPIRDPGWPAGAAAVFNTPARIASWEGPPFGGGQSFAECRGDAKALSAVLAGFAKIEAKSKRVVLYNGVGNSFWLNPNNEVEKRDAAKMDWSFMVWQPASWERMRKMPVELTPPDVLAAADGGPPTRIDVYTGGNVRWSDVVVPDEIEVVDERLEAHGFKPDDGVVLEGKVVDVATRKPIAARIVLERVEPQKKGGYKFTPGTKTIADAAGHWVLTKVSPDWQRVVVEADGYVPRVAGYVRYEQPGWHSYEISLSPAVSVSGRVTDDAGKSLEGVNVQLTDVAIKDGDRKGNYDSPNDLKATTDADGRFELTAVPIGETRVRVYKSGYCQPGLGPTIKTPAKDIALEMTLSGQIHVTVDFGGAARPEGYIVELEPAGGNKVGSWGGSSNINQSNEVSFNDVPPGRYVVFGHPNPYGAGEMSQRLTFDLKGGERKEITLGAGGK